MSQEDERNKKFKAIAITAIVLSAIAFALGAFLAVRTSEKSPSPSTVGPTVPKVPFVSSPTQLPLAPQRVTPKPTSPPANPTTNSETFRLPAAEPTASAPTPEIPNNRDSNPTNEDRD